jgi:oxygen-independent coproporphyrinogen-3 oxidase
MMKTNSLGIYIHIPFCLKKCGYCDFISFDQKDAFQLKEYEIELLNEIRSYGEGLEKTLENNQEKGSDKEIDKYLYKEYIVDSVFFGGGTPSILPQEMIGEILDQIRTSFFLSPNAEISIEANPGTLTEEKLAHYLNSGINSLSLGVQSFDDDLLKLLGRVHGANDAKKAYKIARDVGFKNISLDLMFAIPSQNTDTWEQTLMETLALNPEHISFYGLSYEEGTPFDQARKRKEILPITEELDREMYRKGLALLKDNGYEHYEISNMSKPGFPCRHNLKYWSMEDYLGVGIGAHSFLKGKRFSNTGNWEKYFTKNKIEEEHLNSVYDNISEFIFTGMRKREGINFHDFRQRFGRDYFEYLGNRKQQLIKYRDKEFLAFDFQGMHLTEEGIDFSNGILADIM